MRQDMFSDKTLAREAAVSANVPVLLRSKALAVTVKVVMYVAEICLPAILKSDMCRGGKGIHVVQDRDDLNALFKARTIIFSVR